MAIHRKSRRVDGTSRPRGPASGVTRKVTAGALALLIGVGIVPSVLAPAVSAAPAGQGFTVTASDLAFILKQIKIAEAHVANTDAGDRPVRRAGRHRPEPDPEPAALATACGRSTARATTSSRARRRSAPPTSSFPRLTTPVVPGRRDVRPAASARQPLRRSYAQKTGNVFDSQPRVISNLIVDQTSTNPAAVAAAGNPVRTQGNEGVVPVHDRSRPATRRRSASRRLRAVARDPVHPERDHRRRPLAALQLAVHAVRPVLRPRRRPDRQGRRHGLRAAARPTTR